MVGRKRDSNLCGFEGAKPKLRSGSGSLKGEPGSESGTEERRAEAKRAKPIQGSREAVRWPSRRNKEGGGKFEPRKSGGDDLRPTDGTRRHGSKRREPCSFPVTIA